MKHAAKSGIKVWVLVVAGLALAIVAFGVFLFFQGSSDNLDGSSDSEFSALPSDNLVVELASDSGEENLLSISTPYCDLSYPAEFEDSLKVESLTTEEGESVAFYSSLSDDVVVLLFTVHFGSADGVKIGEFVDGETFVPVYLIVEDITEDKSWSDADLDKVLGMQEGLNVVIEGIENCDSFKSELN